MQCDEGIVWKLTWKMRRTEMEIISERRWIQGTSMTGRNLNTSPNFHLHLQHKRKTQKSLYTNFKLFSSPSLNVFVEKELHRALKNEWNSPQAKFFFIFHALYVLEIPGIKNLRKLFLAAWVFFPLLGWRAGAQEKLWANIFQHETQQRTQQNFLANFHFSSKIKTTFSARFLCVLFHLFFI